MSSFLAQAAAVIGFKIIRIKEQTISRPHSHSRLSPGGRKNSRALMAERFIVEGEDAQHVHIGFHI